MPGAASFFDRLWNALAADCPMKMDYKFEHGQEVFVALTAPSNLRPGASGSVCGMRQLDGQNLYLLEFSDGEAVEIPENLIDATGSSRN